MIKVFNLLALTVLTIASSDDNLNGELFHDHDYLEPSKRKAKCYGIVLSDATDSGPYQAGALIGLLQEQKVGQEYQVITGVALGAINGYILALHDMVTGKKEAITELRKYFIFQ